VVYNISNCVHKVALFFICIFKVSVFQIRIKCGGAVQHYHDTTFGRVEDTNRLSLAH